MNEAQLRSAYDVYTSACKEVEATLELLTMLDVPPVWPEFTPAAQAGEMLAKHGMTKALGIALLTMLNNTPPEDVVAAYRELAYAATGIDSEEQIDSEKQTA